MIFVFSLSDLLHSVWQSLGPFMLLQMALFHSFLWLIFHCIYVPHIFFIYSSVNGHLDCFHVLAVVNSLALLLTSKDICLFPFPTSRIKHLIILGVTFLTTILWIFQILERHCGAYIIYSIIPHEVWEGPHIQIH